jgi:hypothetical protein
VLFRTEITLEKGGRDLYSPELQQEIPRRGRTARKKVLSSVVEGDDGRRSKESTTMYL